MTRKTKGVELKLDPDKQKVFDTVIAAGRVAGVDNKKMNRMLQALIDDWYGQLGGVGR